ncbi:serine protease [Streptomyces roseicoloratus]|uniref:Serine protease n=1 Tax=Streptomyces roseicoloratus TaxID=2508722 RepID=A0ABY9S2F1_9ACTN|nr:serine protease [Streptomyces roseicoloratus]WMX48609.1 serine protease [Streptomyces roseicoloratus]
MNDHPTKRRTLLRGFALTAAGTCLPATATAVAAPPPGPARSGSSALSAFPASSAETYALTLIHLDRAGGPTADHTTRLTALSGPGAGTAVQPHDPSGTVTLRVPKGRYLLDSALSALAADGSVTGTDWIVRPRLDVDRDMTVVVDARTAAPVDVRPPESAAAFSHGGAFVEVTYGGVKAFANVVHPRPNLRIAHLGPAAEPGTVRAWVDTYWTGERGTYVLGYTFSTDRALTGLVRHPRPEDLATLEVRAAAPASGPGFGIVDFGPSSGPSPALAQPLAVPGGVTFLVTPERGAWEVVYSAPSEPEDDTEAAASATSPAHRYTVTDIAVKAGTTTVHTFDSPVFGPAMDPSPGARPPGLRTGNRLDLALALLADGDGHPPSAPAFLAARTTLHRDGVLLGTRQGTPVHASFTVPAGRASYLLTATASRPRPAPGGAPAPVTAAWTFVSAATRSATELPLSIVRFAPPLGVDGTVAPRRRHYVPLVVRGAAERSGVRSLTVEVSTDRGATWSPAPVTGGRFAVTAPEPGGTVSLRVELADTFGNSLTQTHVDAYGTGTTS